jgi:hypothetical protein
MDVPRWNYVDIGEKMQLFYFSENEYIVTWWLKETVIARSQHSKQRAIAMQQPVKMTMKQSQS